MYINYIHTYILIYLSTNGIQLQSQLSLAQAAKTFNLLTGLWRRFLLPKVPGAVIAMVAPPRTTMHHPATAYSPLSLAVTSCQSSSQAVRQSMMSLESHLAFAWFALFIYSSILSKLSVWWMRRWWCCFFFFFFFEFFFIICNCISQHCALTKSIRIKIEPKPIKMAAQSSMMPSTQSTLWTHPRPSCPFPHSHSPACVCAFERYILRRKYAGLHIANILRSLTPLLSPPLSPSLSLSPSFYAICALS